MDIIISGVVPGAMIFVLLWIIEGHLLNNYCVVPHWLEKMMTILTYYIIIVFIGFTIDAVIKDPQYLDDVSITVGIWIAYKVIDWVIGKIVEKMANKR